MSKKSYKKSCKEGCSEETLADKKAEWRKLLKLHNRIRVQELELNNTVAEIKNNRIFNKEIGSEYKTQDVT